jgi:hypothetical protein
MSDYESFEEDVTSGKIIWIGNMSVESYLKNTMPEPRRSRNLTPGKVHEEVQWLASARKMYGKDVQGHDSIQLCCPYDLAARRLRIEDKEELGLYVSDEVFTATALRMLDPGL